MSVEQACDVFNVELHAGPSSNSDAAVVLSPDPVRGSLGSVAESRRTHFQKLGSFSGAEPAASPCNRSDRVDTIHRKQDFVRIHTVYQLPKES